MERRVPIDAIKVEGRHRKDFGDLGDLVKSIASIGLIQPVVVTNDNVLIAGHRRIRACRALGWTEVPTVVPEHMVEAVDLLKAERDENTCRKDMVPSELVTLGLAIEEMERPKANEAKREGQERGRAAQRGELVERTGTPNQLTSGNGFKTADAVGQALGISPRNYERARALVQAAEQGDERAQEEVQRMDETGSITPAYNRWKDRPSAPSGRRKPPTPMEVEPGSRQPPKRRQWDLITSGISALKGLGHGFRTVKELDPDITREEASQLEKELAESLRVLRNFHKKVKEFLDGDQS